MVNFKWKKEDGKLTEKAKAYLRLTYKNQYSEGQFYSNKQAVEQEIVKQPSQKSKILSRKVKQRLAPREPKQIPKQRIRKQKALNLSGSEEPYFIYIRVMTINPNVTERGLDIALRKLINNLQGKVVYLERKNRTKRLDFTSMSEERSKIGTGKERLGKGEDSFLNDMEIHYELKVEMNKTETGIV